MCLQESVTQSMHKKTIYTWRKLHETGVIAFKRKGKTFRHRCNSQNACPGKIEVVSVDIGLQTAYCQATWVAKVIKQCWLYCSVIV